MEPSPTTSKLENKEISMVTTSKPPPNPKIDLKTLIKPSFTELVCVNFAIDRDVLEPYVPGGLQLDDYNGETYVSLIATCIRNVGFMGLPRRFNELSLRLYVKRRDTAISRSGTCFLKNFVSSGTGAWRLSSTFGREFNRLKIKSNNSGFGEDQIPEVDYSWSIEDHTNRLRVKARAPIKNDGPGTKVGFILSHTTHYESIGGQTFEYQVERPNWIVWDAAQANFTCDVKRLFGKEFVKPLARRPASVFVTAGSQVTIFQPSQI
jgi:hypothetical protein